MNDDDLPTLREMAVQAIENCTDPAMLDLIYKLVSLSNEPLQNEHQCA